MIRGIALLILLSTSILLACSQPSAVAVVPAPHSVGQAEAPLPTAGERTYRISPGQTTAWYEAQEKWLRWSVPTKAIAKTGDVDGEITLLLGDQPRIAANHFRVDMRTLVSEIAETPLLSGPAGVFLAQRDHAVRRLLEIGNYPFAEFTATSLDGLPGSYLAGQVVKLEVPGDLTVHNITRPVVLDTEATLQSETLSGTAKVQIRMSDFGVQPPVNNGSMDVEDQLTLVIHFVAKASSIASPVVSLDTRNSKLDTPLASLADIDREQGTDQALKTASAMNLEVVDGRVRVVVAHAAPQAQRARAAIGEVGGEIEAPAVSATGALIPVSAIQQLTDDPAISAIRIPLREE